MAPREIRIALESPEHDFQFPVWRNGSVSMPYFLFVELLGPTVELLGYAAILIGLVMDEFYLEFALLLFILMFL